MLRSHQLQVREVAQKIKAGAKWRRIIANITPGGGKSALPVILAAELIPRLFKKICWVVPRVALQQQAEEAFLDRLFRKLLNHQHLIRVSTNEPNPSRGLAGFATTYQALGFSNAHAIQDFTKHKYCLVLDEPHHIAEDSAAQKALKPLIEKAALTLFMSGTFERGRKEQIAFLPYALAGKNAVLSLRDTDTTKVVNYSRADALAEKAIIPLKFTHMDAKAAFMKGGRRFEYSSFQNASKNMGKAILFTSLQTQYAMDLLDNAVADWRETRRLNARSKLLVVAPTQVLAKKYADYLHNSHMLKPGLATINEGAGALKAIRRFKHVAGGEKLDCLVTVGMAYEGLDVKPVTHIACLTRIRSKPWIEQMLARATRFDPDAGPWHRQEAHVFTPDDKTMHLVVDAIKKEQTPFIKQRQWGGSGLGTGRPAVDLFGDLIPVESGAHSKRSRRLGLDAVESQVVVKTPSEIESDIRQDIEFIVRRYATTKGIPFNKVNARMMSAFGKSRTEMTLDELRRALEWARRKFSLTSRYA